MPNHIATVASAKIPSQGSDPMKTSTSIATLATRYRMIPVLIALALIWGYFAWANPLFLSPRNLSNLSLQIVVTGVVALGLMFVLVIGEIDLSVAATGAVSAAVTAGLAVNSGYDTTVAVLIGLFVGGAIGAIQGTVVTFFRAPAFIVTLGTSLVLQGILLDMLPAGSNLISLVGQPFGKIANIYLPASLSALLLAAVVITLAIFSWQSYAAKRQNSLPASFASGIAVPVLSVTVVGIIVLTVFNSYRGVPLLVASLLGLLGLFAYITTQTRFGLHLYAIGANAEAARRAGISVKSMRIAAFTLTGLFAALGGIIASGRVLGVSPDSANTTLLLEAIAAAVIGGVSLFGGRGSVWAALTGALVMGSVSNGMLLVNASTQTRLEVQGAILTLAVILDAFLSRKGNASR
ncbi:sugar ABC transporter permease [Rhizobium sp. 11515TR]|uniref:sugar ABC transporter permease n=1 Tax=Rhizobium sp. 11515TR TaxID=2028343 RepID=UPI001FCF0A83|nr:ABC transporter permease [Rhizobium sp. 11515TR]